MPGIGNDHHYPAWACFKLPFHNTQTGVSLCAIYSGDLMLRSTRRTVNIVAQFSLGVTERTTSFLRLRPTEPSAMNDRLSVVDATGTELLLVSTIDSFNGVVQWHDRVVLSAGRSTISYAARIDVPEVPDQRPLHLAAPCSQLMTPDHWRWIQPTRYCRPDELGNEAWQLFGRDVSLDRPATGTVVQQICDFVCAQMTFEYGSSGPMTTATDAWSQKRGVCRDFTHIAMSFCRALNIPTRYVFGYIPDIDVPRNGSPQDFCAWFEVLLGDRWWAFDARVNERRIGRIVVARGRDAADVPMISTLGAAEITDFAVDVTVVPRTAG